VHGDLNQDQRERAMAAFKAGKKDILIATDVAARGIDVNDVTHVINHTIPEDHDTYLHRAGRTGRAGKTGIAVTFVDWDDMHKWSLINKALEMGIPEPMETYSSSPHLYTDLEIPEGSKGRLKTAGPPRVREPQAASGSRDGGRDSARGGQRSGGDRNGAQRPARTAQAGTAPSGATQSGGAPSGAAATADGASRPSRSRNRSRTRRPSTPAAE
jgi:superfamily II DNA/RNA helicase